MHRSSIHIPCLYHRSAELPLCRSAGLPIEPSVNTPWCSAHVPPGGGGVTHCTQLRHKNPCSIRPMPRQKPYLQGAHIVTASSMTVRTTNTKCGTTTAPDAGQHPGPCCPFTQCHLQRIAGRRTWIQFACTARCGGSHGRDWNPESVICRCPLSAACVPRASRYGRLRVLGPV